MKMKKLFARGLSFMVAVLFVVALGSFSVSAQTGTASIRARKRSPGERRLWRQNHPSE